MHCPSTCSAAGEKGPTMSIKGRFERFIKKYPPDG